MRYISAITLAQILSNEGKDISDILEPIDNANNNNIESDVDEQ